MGARRSHPPTLIKIVGRTISEECALARGTRILLAVSGGGDSQALLHVLVLLSEKLHFEVAAHGVDHGLRSEASSELDLAEALARELGVSFSRTRLRVPPGGNLMARARAERYAALRAAATKSRATLIATAHHADDRAETVLERLLRGSGPRGLAVLPPRSDDLIRPMIRARRADVRAHLARHRLEYARDPTNDDRRYLRSRLRFEVLPQLESMSPQVVEHLSALADQLASAAPQPIRDEKGDPLRLNRAQTEAVQRLVKSRSARSEVRISGGRAIRLDPASGRLIVVSGGIPGVRGDAKRVKSD